MSGTGKELRYKFLKRKVARHLAFAEEQVELNEIVRRTNEIAPHVEHASLSNFSLITNLGTSEGSDNVSDNSSESCNSSLSFETTDSLSDFEMTEETCPDFQNTDVSSHAKLEDISLREKLRHWAVKFNVKRNAVSALLKILNVDYPDLPVDSRTLLCTARNSEIVSNAGSEFVYFGISNSLQRYDLKSLCHRGKIMLRVNFDGMSLGKSTQAQFWPILGLISSDNTPFVIACFYGQSKPPILQEYLNDFVPEVQMLQANGLQQNGFLYEFEIHNFNCDAPARAFIKGIKNHNAYYGCEKCIQKGTAVGCHVKFLEIEGAKRTDTDFANGVQVQHHIETSPLLSLNLGMISKFPLDTMHLVDLGVIRKLILYWLKNGQRSKSNSVRIGHAQKLQISRQLEVLSECMPSEFSRKPSSLKNIDKWKATEFRQFVLYTGPIVLKNILPDCLYNHFLCLHVAISVLSNPKFSTEERYIKFAEGMLKSFVEDMGRLYGNKSLVYNVHNLLHLAEDVRLYGSIDKFSCYPFVNCLGQLRKMLHTHYKPLAQICKRLSESMPFDHTIEEVQWLHPIGIHNSALCVGEEFTSVVLHNFRISSTNNCDKTIQLKNGKIMCVRHIIKSDGGECILLCSEIVCSGSFFTNPCDSSVVSMYKAHHQTNTLMAVGIEMISSKCILSWDNKVVVSLLHRLM